MAAAGIAFVTLTIAAMLAYPGGTFVDPNTRGYLFFENFFSDLGMTHSYSGAVNLISMLLFVIALLCAGAGVILFFATFLARFPTQPRLSRIGSLFGILTAICFLGIALAPQDLFSDVHDFFSIGAFLFLLFASSIYTYVILHTPAYPKKFALLFGGLSGSLMAYIILFLFGPPLTSSTGILIQATGQKLIVYAAMFCLWIQTLSGK